MENNSSNNSCYCEFSSSAEVNSKEVWATITFGGTDRQVAVNLDAGQNNEVTLSREVAEPIEEAIHTIFHSPDGVLKVLNGYPRTLEQIKDYFAKNDAEKNLRSDEVYYGYKSDDGKDSVSSIHTIHGINCDLDSDSLHMDNGSNVMLNIGLLSSY